jgi:hypothetical protein
MISCSISKLEALSIPDRWCEKAKMAASTLEYDATKMLDKTHPKFEVKLLADPAKMARRIINDDGIDTVIKVVPMPDQASITDWMHAPRMSMMYRTEIAMIEAYDHHVRSKAPFPSSYPKAMLYDAYEISLDPKVTNCDGAWVVNLFLTDLDRYILRSVRLTKAGKPDGDVVFVAIDDGDDIEDGHVPKL